MPRRLSRTARAAQANEHGRVLDDAGRPEAALAAYRRAIRLQPDWAVPWYNAGLVHKYAGRWRESLQSNLQAMRLDAGHEAAAWNAGIAATALGEWDTARHAWRRCGIRVPEGPGPVDLPLGLTPIRVSCAHNPEVIWADRIDPARAVIRNVPLPPSDRRFGDLVLHDGAPNGYRLLAGREVPVFDELQLLEASDYATYEVRITGASESALQALDERARAQGMAAENWTVHTRILCKACSEGRPFGEGQHDHGPAVNADGDGFRVGLAARTELELRRLLADWAREIRGATVGDVRCVKEAA